MKHRVRLHGKRPRESQKRQAKPPPKALTPADLVKAVRHRDWPTVRQSLLEKIDPKTVQIHGDPLVLAVTAIAPVRVVQAVLKAGADPNATNVLRETALFHASDPKIVELLLVAGADPNHRSKLGLYPLHTFAARGLPHGIELLIQAGAMLEAQDDERRTPLLRAVVEQKPEAVAVLLKHHANMEARNKLGLAPLHHAVKQRTKAAEIIVQQLIAAGTDVRSLTPEGEEPLMLARTVSAAELLLRAGADVNAATPDGVTALHLAVKRGDVDVARVLLQAKANSQRTISDKHADKRLAGKSARDLAAASASPDVRRLFAWS